MIIDFHTHVFPDSLASGAIASLEKIAGIKAQTDGTVDGLLSSMDRGGIDKSVVCPVSTKPTQVTGINSWIIGMKDDRLVPFGTLFPDMEQVDDEAKRLADNGIRGIKLHPDYQTFFVDDERVFPIYEACVRHNLIVLFHAGVDIGLPPPIHSTPSRLAIVLDRFPDMTVVAAHMGGFRLWDDVDRYLVGREIYFDTAYIYLDLSEERFLTLARDHGASRILFSSDCPWFDQKKAMGVLDDWAFSNGERHIVYGGNAAALLGIDAR